MSVLLQYCHRLQFIRRTNAQHLLPSLHIRSHRNKSTLPPTNNSLASSTSATATGANKWTPIYRLPLIRMAAAFIRLKVYQTIFTAAAIPIALTLENAGVLATNSWVVCSAIGVSGILTLTVASYGAQNLVGFIYTNELENTMKVAFVDFWGKRKEIEIDIDDLMPDLEQKKSTLFDFYQVIRLHSDNKLKFKLLHRYGVAVDPEKFTHFFGE